MKYLSITAVFTLIFFLSPLLMGSSCNGKTPSADDRQRAATAQLTAEADRQVGMPAINNFQERRFARMISELRDEEVTTYTYTVDMNGNRHFLCQSVGFGLPYSTQMTNPERAIRWGGNNSRTIATIPQAEPNGLFMPDNVDATWVLCLNPDTGDISPIYSEPQLLVSPFRLDTESSTE